MKRKGICYDVETIFGVNWRPDYDTKISHRELEIIKNDLHCNAVRVRCYDIERLMVNAEGALQQGLEVWLSPESWNKSPEQTMDYTMKAATAAETLYK